MRGNGMAWRDKRGYCGAGRDFRLSCIWIKASSLAPGQQEELAFSWQRDQFARFWHAPLACAIAEHQKAPVIVNIAFSVCKNKSRGNSHCPILEVASSKSYTAADTVAALGVGMFLSMLFMFFFFLGSLVMFLYLFRKIDNIAHALSDEHAQIRVLLRAMESRMDKMSHMEKISSILQEQMDGQEDRAGHDSLLHLSFEKPAQLNAPVDPGLDLNIEPQPWEMADQQNKPQA